MTRRKRRSKPLPRFKITQLVNNALTIHSLILLLSFYVCVLKAQFLNSNENANSNTYNSNGPSLHALVHLVSHLHVRLASLPSQPISLQSYIPLPPILPSLFLPLNNIHHESSTKQNSRLLKIMMFITQRSHTTRFKQERRSILQRLTRPPHSERS